MYRLLWHLGGSIGLGGMLLFVREGTSTGDSKALNLGDSKAFPGQGVRGRVREKLSCLA